MKIQQIGIFIAEIDFAVGGTESYFASLLQAIQEIYPNASFTVITTYMKKDGRKSSEELREILNNLYGVNIQKKFTIARIPYDMHSHIGTIQGNIWYKKYTKKFDICFNCTRNMLVSKANKNYAIIHFPVQPYSKSKLASKNKILKRIMLKWDKRWKESYDIFLCNSEYTEYWLKKIWNVNETKTKVLYPPIQRLNNSNEKKKQIFISSRIDSTKSIHVLIKAYLDMNYDNVKLVIAGAKLPEHENYYQSLLQLDKNNIIEWHLNPSRLELENLYKESLIFWHAKGFEVEENEHPDLLEHFGMTTVEAMSAGCIPIVINKGGQKEIVDEGINGYKWNNEEELIQKTCFVLQQVSHEKIINEAIKKSELYDYNSFRKSLKSYVNIQGEEL